MHVVCWRKSFCREIKIKLKNTLDQLYSKGLHLLITAETQQEDLLCDAESFLLFVKKIFLKHDVEVVGTTHYIFDNNSFTASVILKESHLCIHTWPEFNNFQFDLYLCNYLRDNSDKVEQIGLEIVQYFNSTIIQENKINR